jgi:hypothetical protein
MKMLEPQRARDHDRQSSLIVADAWASRMLTDASGAVWM